MERKELLLILAKHLESLLELHETRINNSLIDCTVFLMQTKPEEVSNED